MSPHTPPPSQVLHAASRDRTHWLELPARRASVKAARHDVAEWLGAWSLPGQLRADAVLLVSELATNAVVHTLSHQILCGINLIADDRGLRIEVHDDDSTGRSLPRCRPGLDDEGGRGLFIVRELADTWGVEHSTRTGGNAVWATLRTCF
ncbi:ATP-binding protein [Streptomyces sp. AK02-04a]|uniref:ATP-binding protein n=1 Tax=Streptomyces sp. AK02-04a TaxID=3028649 RepID=UPI0029A1D3C0|nr:ATP-binding protein [Streptomyces sp. AK02-04a]MDX3763126.1 ATP-binding protein [Streptomyces sp. AK02-04a]